MLGSIRSWIQNLAARNPGVQTAVVVVARSIGYDTRRWTRVVYQQECHRIIQELGPERLDVLEISAGSAWRNLPFRSYREANYPEFDICKEPLQQTFDLIIADQVFEHLLWPYKAGQNVLRMLRPGGHFLVITPFLIRVHEVPYDCTRWTQTGMRYFLAECGFDLEDIRTDSWGNLSCAKAALETWPRVGWSSSLRNDSTYPVVVWALAKRKGAEA